MFSLEEALNSALKEASLNYLIQGKTIFISRRALESEDIVPEAFYVTTIHISGKVTGADGAPLEAVSIMVKGKNKGTLTDEKGMFALTVDKNETIDVALIGYKSYSFKATSDKFMNISLAATASDLTDIVVVGYGTQKKENLTGAIGVIKSASLSDRPTPSPANLLQGLSPGVTVTTQGSYPGASANIKIREASTWAGGTDPLYVIDGFVRDATSFATISPSDIDNISILKDAASAAIYGIKGGNGVILVTTKHGVTDKTVVSYNASYTLNTREITPRRMNAFEAYTFADQAYDQKKYSDYRPKLLHA